MNRSGFWQLCFVATSSPSCFFFSIFSKTIWSGRPSGGGVQTRSIKGRECAALSVGQKNTDTRIFMKHNWSLTVSISWGKTIYSNFITFKKTGRRTKALFNTFAEFTIFEQKKKVKRNYNDWWFTFTPTGNFNLTGSKKPFVLDKAGEIFFPVT